MITAKPLAASMAAIVRGIPASSSTTRIVRIRSPARRPRRRTGRLLRAAPPIGFGSSAARGNSTLTVVPLPSALSIRTPPPDWLATP